jgi:hypothetical protein
MNRREVEIEAAAAALGKCIGPPDGCSRWAPHYLDKIRWPQDYTENERSLLRSAAIAMFEAIERFRAKDPRLGPRGTLLCDICDKPQKTLGVHEGSKWSICMKCFERADAIAERQDRWPNDDDFVYLRKAHLKRRSSKDRK